jgi:hypothetical protein
MGFSGQPKPDQANVLIQAQQQIALQVSPLSKTCMVNPFLYFWFVSTEGNLWQPMHCLSVDSHYCSQIRQLCHVLLVDYVSFLRIFKLGFWSLWIDPYLACWPWTANKQISWCWIHRNLLCRQLEQMRWV